MPSATDSLGGRHLTVSTVPTPRSALKLQKVMEVGTSA